MDKGTLYSLKVDIVSYCRGGHVYGHAGDQVKVIAEHGNVIIAEDEKGERFPVKANYLVTGLSVENNQPVPPEIQSNKIPPRKTKPAKIINQPSLF